jgi:hypothetical protein
MKFEDVKIASTFEKSLQCLNDSFQRVQLNITGVFQARYVAIISSQ